MNVHMSVRFIFIGILLCTVFSVSFAQSRTDDFEAANQYVIWIRQALEEERHEDAYAAITRSLDFSDVNSDISFLAAFYAGSYYSNISRSAVISHLDKAIEVDRWNFYSKDEALILKAGLLIHMRRYSSALSALDQIMEGDIEAAMLRLKAFRGIAYNSLGMTEIAALRALTLSAMNRFSHDPRPAVIFLEYLQFRKKHNTNARFEIDISDQQVLDIILRRLPILVELDPNLAWMAAPFMQNNADARRYVAAYRSGGFSENPADFIPHPCSIPLALNYGLIDDFQAVEELFHINTEIPLSFIFDDLNDTYYMLRSEEGRELFSLALLNYSGYILISDSSDGLIKSIVLLREGVARMMGYDRNYEGVYDFVIEFDANSVPVQASFPALDFGSGAFYSSDVNVRWELYPFVNSVTMPGERFFFRPADFSYAPVEFIMLGGSRTRPGIIFPVISNHNELTRRTLVSFCESIERPSEEFEGAIERIILEGGIPRQAAEYLIENGRRISVTEFEGGIPVIQYVDLDFDGRMETTRRFHRPGSGYQWPDFDERFDYLRLIASSESDWRGDGRFITREVYHPDGSVVYQYDMDGDGIIDYSETRRLGND